ncbi:YndJ family transporter [Paractinoplanes maris]|uniref:YndJ family transporter n=1 Tax=Paractinoplanes maris TaxID=1734446 RepID=UPI0020220F31|nr:YndJ family transporter [Actinoplanes maris]
MDRLSATGWVGLHVVVGVCVLLFVPLGLGALGRGRAIVRWWPVVAVPAVIALMLPRGWGAGVLCVPYLAGCLAVPIALRRDKFVAFAAACLPVAAAGLVAERVGVALLGFPAGVLGLTAAHFHVAGFGALLLLALTDARYRLPAPAGVAVVGLGFLVGDTVGDLVELVGAGVLSAGLWLALGTRAGRGARWLFALSLVTMSLALLYAAGQVTGIPHLGLTWMVLTHGVLNAAAVLTALVVAWAGREQRWSAHRWSYRIGRGRDRFEAASGALLAWEMHRRAGAWVDPGTPPAMPGQHMSSSLGVGRLRVAEPCEVLEVVRDADRTSMHYLALPGHTFAGDERFSVLLGADGVVRFEVSVRSKPALLIARLAGPLVPVAQFLFIARCAAVLQRAPSPSWA